MRLLLRTASAVASCSLVLGAAATIGIVGASSAGAAPPPSSPDALDDNFQVLQDKADVVLPVLANDVRGVGGTPAGPAVVRVSSGATPAGGSFACVNSGGCSYTPPAGYLGTDSFQYSIGFRSGNPPNFFYTTADHATVSITVVPNGPPTAVDDVAQTKGTAGVTTRVTDNDLDPNLAAFPEKLTATPISSTSAHGGTVECFEPFLDCGYRPPAGFVGVDSYDYTLTDAAGASDVGTVTVTVAPDLPPTAVDDPNLVVYAAQSSFSPQRFSLDLLSNDSDPDDAYLQFDNTPVTTSAGGQFGPDFLSNGQSVYVPPVGFSGIDSFTYTVIDGYGGSASAIATVDVRVDQPPIAVTDHVTTRGTAPVSVNPVVNDSDDFDNVFLNPSQTTTAHGGSVTCSYDAAQVPSCSYTAAAGFVGADSFPYTVYDNHQATEGTVDVTVTADVAPVIESANVTVHLSDPDKPSAPFIGLVVSDAEDDPVFLSSIDGAQEFATAKGAQLYCFTSTENTVLNETRPPYCVYSAADPAYRGTDEVTLRATDGHGGSSTRTITINIVDAMPVQAPDVAASTMPDVPVTIDVAPIADNYPLGEYLYPVRSVSPESEHGGTVSCGWSDGYLVTRYFCSYSPPAGFVGTDTFQYQFYDEGYRGLPWSDAGTVTVRVAPAGPADIVDPTVSIGSPVDGASFSLGQSVAASYTCADAGSGVASCAAPVLSGALLDTSVAGDHTFTVAATDAAGNHASATVTYHVLAGDVNVPVVGPQSVDTDPGNAGASASVPLQTHIDVPSGVSGTVSVTPGPAGSAPTGYVLFGRQVAIAGPVAPGASVPYVVRFTLDSSELGSTALADVVVFRNGVALAACSSPTDAVPDPCLASKTLRGDGDAELVVRTTQFSTWSLGRRAFVVGSTAPASRAQGASSQTLVITGAGFAPTSSVKFSGAGVSVVSTTVSSPTSITVVVNVGASAAVGSRDVTVTNPGNTKATCTGCFTVNAKPTVTSIAPGARPQGSSHETLIVTGTNFAPGATTTVSGAGVTVHTTTFVAATQLSLDVSIDPAAVSGKRDVIVTNPDGGTATGTKDFSVTVPPTVTSLKPTVVHRGATATVAVSGSGFAATFATDGGTVSFGPGIVVGSVTRNSAAKLTVDVTVAGDATVGSRDITVTNPDGGSAGCAGCIAVVADPSVASVTPAAAGQGVAHQIVTVNGSGFQAGATAKFTAGGVTVNTTTVDSSTSLSLDITVGAGAAVGSRDLTITNPDSGTTTCTACYTVNAKPALTSLTPATLARGAANQTVVLIGSGFQPGAVVTFAGTGVSVTIVSSTPTATTLSVTVAASAATGNRAVTITNLDGGTATKATGLKVT